MGLKTVVMTGPWVAIQRNPRSGSGRRRLELVELCSSLRRHSITPRLFVRREDFDERVREPTSRSHLVAVVAAGGDGTVVDVVNRNPELPLAVLPMGTENLLARYLGLPASGRELGELIAAGCTRRIDVGRANGQLFTLVASAGFDAFVAHLLHNTRSGHITHFSYAQPIWTALRTYRYPRMSVYLDDDPIPIEGIEVMVSNLPAYGMGLKVGQSARPDDGRFVVTILQRGSAFQMARYAIKLWRGTHERAADVRVMTASRVRIGAVDPSGRSIPFQVDGDPSGVVPVELECLPGSLEVFVLSDRQGGGCG
jgi:diacylglycerol kinase family enzyme